MATAQTLIDRAMRLIGALESGESPTSDETADVLVALNQMIDSWRNDVLTVYQIAEYTHTLTPSTGSYTIGSGAAINQTRPVKIVSAFIREGSIDYPMKIVGKAEYDRIVDKTTDSNIPSVLYYDPGYANGTIYIYPVPNAANVLHASAWGPIGTLATAGTSVSLPPGYERALTYNLAVDIAPEFQVPVPAEVAKVAKDSLAAIKRLNAASRPLVSRVEATAGRSYEITADE